MNIIEQQTNHLSPPEDSNASVVSNAVAKEPVPNQN